MIRSDMGVRDCFHEESLGVCWNECPCLKKSQLTNKQQGKDEARDERKENEGLTTLLRLLVFLFCQFPWSRVFVGWNPCKIH